MNHRGKLYFFPAFLPLVEILPWLLTAMGALAGFLVGARGRWKKFVWPARALFVLSLIGLGWFTWPRVYWRWHAGESRLTDLPALETIAPPPAAPEFKAATFRPAPWRDLWRVKLTSRALSSPVVSGGLVIFGTWENTVEAYSLIDGSLVWRVHKKEPVFSLTLAAPNLLLAGEGLHTAPSAAITAISLPSGRPLWSREFPGHIESAPTATADHVWLGTGPAGLWCLDAHSGEVLWHSQIGHVDSTPLLSGGSLFVSSQPVEGENKSVFWRLDPSTGKILWSLPLPGQPWGSPHFDVRSQLLVTSTGVGQVGVNLATDHGWAHGINLSGKSAWTTELSGNPIEASVQPAGRGLVVFALTKGEVVALKSADGRVAWHRPLPGPMQADLAMEPGSGTVAAAGSGGTLFLFEGKSGTPLEPHLIDNDSTSAPLFLPDGALLAGPYTLRRVSW
ncbi:MAG: PQQ-binding-like beta-propeller repeat protein [Bdellovibrionota bacterium]